jgi:hypothetical protein
MYVLASRELCKNMGLGPSHIFNDILLLKVWAYLVLWPTRRHVAIASGCRGIVALP